MRRLAEDEIEEFRQRWFTALQNQVNRRVKITKDSLSELAEERKIESGLPIHLCKQFVMEDAVRLKLTVFGLGKLTV